MRQDIATYLSLDGQITPLQQSTLSTSQSGTVTAVYANEGQHVNAGQLLAQLDNSTLRAQLAQQEALASQAQALLGGQTLQANITPSQAQSTVATANQQLATAKNNLSTAQAALINAKLVYDGDVALYKQGYVAQDALQAAQRRVRAGAADREQFASGARTGDRRTRERQSAGHQRRPDPKPAGRGRACDAQIRAGASEAAAGGDRADVAARAVRRRDHPAVARSRRIRGPQPADLADLANRSRLRQRQRAGQRPRVRSSQTRRSRSRRRVSPAGRSPATFSTSTQRRPTARFRIARAS